MKHKKQPTIALTIAGSDCSGGAGIDADLKTFSAFKVYGMACVTCVVAESPCSVISIQPILSKVVSQQIACCLKNMPSMPVKTGMLYSAEIIRTCHREISNFQSQISNLIVDPVMVATSGKRLLQSDAIRALKKLLEEHADLVTPNLDEAEILSDCKIRSYGDMERAAYKISKRFDCAVLMKGGHLMDKTWASDFIWHKKKGSWLRSRRISGVKTHGTGCTYSAAITANLALGHSIEKSVQIAKKFVTNAIRKSHRFGPWMALNHQA
jgi:hydroxymethylpyrimidine/phosphomethylpyrimidine kinase